MNLALGEYHDKRVRVIVSNRNVRTNHSVNRVPRRRNESTPLKVSGSWNESQGRTVSMTENEPMQG